DEPVRHDPGRRLRPGRSRGGVVRRLPAQVRLARARLRSEGVVVPLQPTVPVTLTRLGVVMTPDLSDPNEVEGVLTPASGRTPEGTLYLLARLVARRNL